MYYRGLTSAMQELDTLPVPERVQLVEDVWDSIARNNAEVTMPQWQKAELDRRKRNYLKTRIRVGRGTRSSRTSFAHKTLGSGADVYPARTGPHE